jgi:hypothetical protein
VRLPGEVLAGARWCHFYPPICDIGDQMNCRFWSKSCASCLRGGRRGQDGRMDTAPPWNGVATSSSPFQSLAQGDEDIAAPILFSSGAGVRTRRAAPGCPRGLRAECPPRSSGPTGCRWPVVPENRVGSTIGPGPVPTECVRRVPRRYPACQCRRIAGRSPASGGAGSRSNDSVGCFLNSPSLRALRGSA